MTLEEAAGCLAELGATSRLETFRLLVRAGPDGLRVNEIQEYLDIPGSTLSHHLARLVSSGLVTQSREGRVLRCRIDYVRVDAMLSFLKEDCCAGLELHAVGADEKDCC